MRSFLGWWWGGCRGVLSFQTHMSQQRLFFLRLIHPLNETRHDSARPLTKDNCGFGQTFKDGVGGFGGWWWWRRGRGGGRKAAEVKSSFSPSVLRFTYNTTGTKGRSYTTVTPPTSPHPHPVSITRLITGGGGRRRREGGGGGGGRWWFFFYLIHVKWKEGTERKNSLHKSAAKSLVFLEGNTRARTHTRAQLFLSGLRGDSHSSEQPLIRTFSLTLTITGSKSNTSTI